MRKILLALFISTILASVFFSCTTIKNYKYFADISDSAKLTQIVNNYYKEPIIQIDDILFIAIQTADPLGGNSINSINAQAAGANSTNLFSSNAITGNQATTYGYLVDKTGDVNLPILGSIHLAGLTTTEARIAVLGMATKYYKEPSVIIRFANFRVTVLGEVQRPGTYLMANERVSLLDALGYAGDLTIYGKRDNILLLRRESSGSTLAIRLDLTKSSILKSPYFYLQQNDELYVEPSKVKITGSDASQTRNIAIATSALSLVIILLTRIK